MTVMLDGYSEFDHQLMWAENHNLTGTIQYGIQTSACWLENFNNNVVEHKLLIKLSPVCDSALSVECANHE